MTNITDYGAFVELEAGVEGLVHVSEMSWTKKNVHPGKIVSTSQEVDVMVLEIDTAKRRVSLGLKQTMRNPWEVFAETHPEGTPVEGEVKNITEFGLFIGLDNGFFQMERTCATCRGTGPNSAPNALAWATRWTCASPMSTRRPAAWACRSRRARSPKRKRPWNSTARPTRVHRLVISLARP